MPDDLKTAPKGGKRPVSTKRSAWHSVSIIPGPNACPAVRELGRKRWLSAEAPRFPIPECTAPVCDCRYKHHADRRAGPRRRMDRKESALPRSYAGPERRARDRDRRKA